MKRYGIVLIGCGYIGKQHMDDLYFRDELRIVGVADTDADRARAFAARYGAERWSVDYRELIALPETDIVIICSWVRSHCEILRDCVAAGKHVLCEKPLSADHEETRRTAELIRTAPVKIQLALILRHNLSCRKTKELLDSGTIGRLTLIKMTLNHHVMEPERFRSLLEDCPSFFDCGIHYYDLAAWFTGSPIKKVRADAAFLDADSPNENFGCVHLTTESGCLVQYEAGWSQNLPACSEKLFVGEKGYIRLTMTHERAGDREEGDLIRVYHSDTGVYETVNVPSLYKNMYGQLTALINAIENHAETVPSADEMLAATEVAFAAVRAARTGETILL